MFEKRQEMAEHTYHCPTGSITDHFQILQNEISHNLEVNVGQLPNLHLFHFSGRVLRQKHLNVLLKESKVHENTT